MFEFIFNFKDITAVLICPYLFFIDSRDDHEMILIVSNNNNCIDSNLITGNNYLKYIFKLF